MLNKSRIKNIQYTYFFGAHNPFSNWHYSEYKYDNVIFCCVEQGVMWSKAKLFSDEEIANEILTCAFNEQGQMKRLGRNVKNFNQYIWDSSKIKIYSLHCKNKFIQNEKLMQELINTGNTQLVEASPYDKIWGIGLHECDARIINPSKWPGKNLLGKILTEIRDNYKKNQK